MKPSPVAPLCELVLVPLRPVDVRHRRRRIVGDVRPRGRPLAPVVEHLELVLLLPQKLLLVLQPLLLMLWREQGLGRGDGAARGHSAAAVGLECKQYKIRVRARE